MTAMGASVNTGFVGVVLRNTATSGTRRVSGVIWMLCSIRVRVPRSLSLGISRRSKTTCILLCSYSPKFLYSSLPLTISIWHSSTCAVCIEPPLLLLRCLGHNRGASVHITQTRFQCFQDDVIARTAKPYRLCVQCVDDVLGY